MSNRSVLPVLLLSCGLLAAQDKPAEKAPPPGDRTLVRRAVLDYVEAAYRVEPDRIARSVDKKLVKLGFVRRSEGDAYRARPMTYDQLHALVGRWNKDGRIPKDAPKKVEVLHVLDQIACAKLTAHWGIDYMQLVKARGKWKIRQVLWQRAPDKGFRASAKDKAAVRQAALDYVEGIYEAKPERIERSVHEKLAKLGFYRPAGAARSLAMPMTFSELRGLAASLYRNRKPPATAPKEITLLDVLDQTACVKLVGAWGIDYMHLAKYDGKWKIIHVLWQSHPPKQTSPSAKDGTLRIKDAVNEVCPFSGDPIRADSLTSFEGKVLGFCNSGCRDKFARNPKSFPEVMKLLR